MGLFDMRMRCAHRSASEMHFAIVMAMSAFSYLCLPGADSGWWMNAAQPLRLWIAQCDWSWAGGKPSSSKPRLKGACRGQRMVRLLG